MAWVDNFAVWLKSAAALLGSGTRHEALDHSDTVDLTERPRGLWFTETGTVVLVDELGNALPYDVTAGQQMDFRPTRINATNTTVTEGSVYGWF